MQEDTHWNTNNGIYGDNPSYIGGNPVPDNNAMMQSLNLYVYCTQNPIMYSDPSGYALTAAWNNYLTGKSAIQPIGKNVITQPVKSSSSSSNSNSNNAAKQEAESARQAMVAGYISYDYYASLVTTLGQPPVANPRSTNNSSGSGNVGGTVLGIAVGSALTASLGIAKPTNVIASSTYTAFEIPNATFFQSSPMIFFSSANAAAMDFHTRFVQTSSDIEKELFAYIYVSVK